MRRSPLPLAAVVLLVLGCAKTEIAVQNSITQTGTNVNGLATTEVDVNGLCIGTADLGDVAYGETTGYVQGAAGSLPITYRETVARTVVGTTVSTDRVTPADTGSDDLYRDQTIDIVEGRKNLVIFLWDAVRVEGQ